MKSFTSFLNSDSRILYLIGKKEDEAGLRMLYRANRSAVTGYVLQNSGTAEEAEEILQDAIVALWEKVRSGKFQYEAKLSTFIFSTAKNMWLRRLARRRREVAGADVFESAPSDDPSPLESLLDNERAKRVADALKILGEPCRRLLLLFYWQEKSLVEIASAMGFANADTVKARKYQCKKALERLLKRDE